MIEKVRYYCKRVHSSSKNREYFRKLLLNNIKQLEYSNFNNFSNRFMKIQINAFKEKNLEVVMDVETRWNSTFDMIDRALKLKKSLSAVSNHLVNNGDSTYATLNESDWKKCDSIVKILEPFYQSIVLKHLNYIFLKRLK